jgi:hypothetical protein
MRAQNRARSRARDQYGSRRLCAYRRKSPCGWARDLTRCRVSLTCEPCLGSPGFAERLASSRLVDDPAHCGFYIVRYEGGLMPRLASSVDPCLQQNRLPALTVGTCVHERRLANEPRSTYAAESSPAISDSGLSKGVLGKLGIFYAVDRNPLEQLTPNHIPAIQETTYQCTVSVFFSTKITYTSRCMSSFGRPSVCKWVRNMASAKPYVAP